MREASDEELARLADKYARMAELRRAHPRGGAEADPRELRALATEFPGALRELDRLPTNEIDRRARSLRVAAAGGAREPWMSLVASYHAALRSALRSRARAADPSRAQVPVATRERAEDPGPSRRGMVARALESVARQHDTSVDEVRSLVLPPRSFPG